MTASKPPDKTLVGMPSDLKAVLQKLDQAVADKATLIDQPGAAAPFDKTKTRMGQGTERPRSVPPPLPSQRTAAPVLPNAGSLPSAPSAPNAGAPMDRTLIGMPSDLQAALQRALAEVGAAPPQSAQPKPAVPTPAPPPQRPPPTASGPALRAQPVRTIGVPGSPPSEAQAPAFAARGHGLGHASGPTHDTGLGYASGLGYRPDQVPPGSTAMKVLAPQAPLDWPPAARGRSDSGLVPRADSPDQATSAASFPPPPPPPIDARPSADQPAAAPYPGAPSEQSLQPSASAPPPSPEPSLAMQSTHAAPFEAGPGAAAPNAVGAATVQAPRLALPLGNDEPRKTKKVSDAPKRWPAISLILLAVVAFGGVIVLRAPQLLPAPLSGLLAPTPAVPDELIATDAPVLPATPAPATGVTSDRAAATDPAKAAPTTPTPTSTFTPTPTRPPAAPVMTSGASAQLEKKAIERLIANDYPSAKQLYEQLRSAEPTRSEFAVMVELLNRAGAAPCGQPGQVPCAGPRP